MGDINAALSRSGVELLWAQSRVDQKAYIVFSQPMRRQGERCLSRNRVFSSRVKQTSIWAIGLIPKRVEVAIFLALVQSVS